MKFANLAASISALATLAQAVDDWMGCDYRDFCSRHREHLLSELDQHESSFDYTLDGGSVQITSDQILTASLHLRSAHETMADQLEIALQVYEDGILRVMIDDTQAESERFRIMEQPILTEGVDLTTLNMMEHVDIQEGKIVISGQTEDLSEEFRYEIAEDPFGISHFINDKEVSKVNPVASLYVEDAGQLTPEGTSSESGVYDDLGYPMLINFDYATSVSMGFFFPSKHLYGLPGREYDFDLKSTEESGPYRLFNRDLDPHWPRNRTELYGSIPYVTAHSTDFDSSIAWMNSADTWVEVLDFETETGEEGTYVDFLSEGGMLEFFMFGSTKHPGRVQKQLAKATGFLELPPIHTLGFQFSKWAPVSADMITERSQNFTKYGFPVDVFWLDIEHALWAEKETIETRDYRWFTFNPTNFTEVAMDKMKGEVSKAGRRLVTIIDPHINANDDYFVYADAMKLQDSEWAEGDSKNIFVRNELGETLYAEAWPGNSTFMDFLNENARQFWKEQFTKFEGTSSLFYAWNDVNDPCVFNGPIKTMPVQYQHVMKDGSFVLHRDVHNAYGTLEHMSSYKGWKSKYADEDLRPFILSRSYFFGSQKYGPMWTGDTQALLGEPWGSLNEMLSIGVAGHPFGGADIPGYKLEPPEDLWVMMYQLGTFYPFFRAHNEINYQDREPWNQNERIQEVIRGAINLRYDLIHYIYTMFYQGSSQGTPLVRAMWFEFPKLQEMTNQDTQFMFGQSLLVCPKLEVPTDNLWQVTCALPKDTRWYNWNTRQARAGDETLTQYLKDSELGIWVRERSILPILQHTDEMSLLHALGNGITLEVYPDAQAQAEGLLYMDDGQTFAHKTRCEKTYMRYTYDNSVLSVESTLGSECRYKGAELQKVTRVTVFEMWTEPARVVSLEGEELPFAYNVWGKSVTVETDFSVYQAEKTDLFKIVMTDEIIAEEIFLEQ